MAVEESGAENWKYKYLDALEQIEQNERRFAHAEQVLRRGMGRLAIGCHGHSAELDQKLDMLRSELSGASNLEDVSDLIDEIGEQLRGLDAHFTSPNMVSPSEVLLALLDLVSISPEQSVHKQELRQKLQAAGGVDFDACVSEVGRLINERGISSAHVLADANRQVQDALLEMLECLSFPESFVGRVKDIKSLLVAAGSDQVESAVKNVTRLVADMRGFLEAEKRALEIFLHQLSTRLSEFDSFLVGVDNDQQVSLENSRKLNMAVSEEISGLQTAMDEENNIDEMKRKIQIRVDMIRHHVKARRDHDEERKSQLEQQLKQLGQRLQQMEEETDSLRQRLAEERQQAQVDPLTELPNRLAYELRIVQEFERWQRYQHPLSILLLDVDRFKSINDTYGHKAGDKALTVIARTIAEHVRGTDFCARIGGEEFLLLLPETSLNEAVNVGEKLRQSVEACHFAFKGSRVPVTISAGVSEFRGGDGIDDVFTRADEALYQAKNGGRNQVVAETI